MNWKALYNDLRAVLMKHFRPAPELESPEIILIRHLGVLQRQQESINRLRLDLAPVVKLLKNDGLFREFDRLAALAETDEPEAFDRKDFDGFDDDIMFI